MIGEVKPPQKGDKIMNTEKKLQICIYYLRLFLTFLAQQRQIILYDGKYPSIHLNKRGEIIVITNKLYSDEELEEIVSCYHDDFLNYLAQIQIGLKKEYLETVVLIKETIIRTQENNTMAQTVMQSIYFERNAHMQCKLTRDYQHLREKLLKLERTYAKLIDKSNTLIQQINIIDEILRGSVGILHLYSNNNKKRPVIIAGFKSVTQSQRNAEQSEA